MDVFDLSPEHADAINNLLPTCNYVVGIRENKTGEVRFCPQNLPWDDHTLSWWNSGNMSCDCNRSLEFHRQTTPDFDDPGPCGDERYSVVGIWFPDGSSIRTLDLLND